MASTDAPRLTAAQAASLTATSEPWLSCDDCFEAIDGYVDALLDSGPPDDEPLRVHLARCPACFDEAESLISLVAADDGLDPAGAIRSFRDAVHRDR